jgi:prepilin-type N-terminal cleavage/methylation domain-containing protein
MKKERNAARKACQRTPEGIAQGGFSLVELMVAMAIFMVIGGAAMSLFQMHATQFTGQQNQVGLNTALRNALTQIEVDVANAGTGYYVTMDKASFPIGVTIVSGGGGNCNVGQNYSAACFDTLNIISTDPNTLPAPPDDGTGTGCTNTTGNTALAIPPPGMTAAQFAQSFKTGDQILFASGLNYNTAVLTGPGVVAGNDVSLPHQPTGAAGVGNSITTDPLQISAANDPNLATSFCAQTAWIIKLAPSTTYGVDVTNAANPQLFRQVGAGPKSPIADQVIGFRMFATLKDNTVAANFDPLNFNYNQIRTLRVSLIGRTPPNLVDPFRNAFDGGPYQIQALSVTANPRNLSMND